MALSSVQPNALESVVSDECQEKVTRERRNDTVTNDLPAHTNTMATNDGWELLLPKQKTQHTGDNRAKPSSVLWESEHRRELTAAQKSQRGNYY